MKRGGAIAVLAVVLWAAAPTAAAEPERLFRATSRSAALHAFYDHEGLFPVPILNVSIPYAEAVFEPGPSSSALASFLWDPQAAELGTILCVLSEGQLCDLPEYPFQDRASYPASGRGEPPPTLEIDGAGAPINVRAAHERADADAGGALGTADVVALEAIRMTPAQASAARTLALAAAPSASVEPWLLSIGEAISRSRVDTTADGVVSRASSALHDVRLLGGLIEIALVRATTVAEVASRGRAEASSELVGVRVADLRARVTREGIELADADVPVSRLRAIEDALTTALDRAGIDLRRGRERTRSESDAAHSEAYVLSLDMRSHVLPEQLPEGTQGRDVLDIPIGFASADAAVAQIVPPAPPPPGGGDPPAGAGGPPLSPPAIGGGAVGGVPPVAAPSPAAAASVPEAAEPFALSNLSVPARAVVVVIAAAVLVALGLTWLRVNEVLHE